MAEEQQQSANERLQQLLELFNGKIDIVTEWGDATLIHHLREPQKLGLDIKSALRILGLNAQPPQISITINGNVDDEATALQMAQRINDALAGLLPPAGG